MKVDLKNFPFLVIDVASFYLALLVSLVIRLGPNFTFEIFSNHVGPFSLVLVGWILVFFVAGFYDIRNFSKRLDYLKIFIVAILISAALSATYFYISSPTGESISPKTILILFVVSFAIIDYLAREVLFKHYLQSKSLQNVLLIGKGKDVEELVNYLIEHPQLGYKVRLWIKEYRREDFDKLIRENGLDVLVIPASLSQNKEIASKIYREMLSGVEVIGFSEFYENIFGKVSIDELEENWFLERLKPKNDFYLLLKRIVDMILAIFILIITLPLWILIVFGIKMSSRGPTMFLGKRAGFKEQEFTPYKFRTMDVGTGDTIIESRGDEFGVVEKDPRVLEFEVPVNIAINLKEIEQMCHFLIVNTTQKSVEEGVAQRIRARLTKTMGVDDMPNLPKWISNSVQKGEDEKALQYVDFLNNDIDSPWKNKIRMAGDDSGDGSINQKSFVKAIKKYVLVANNPVFNTENEEKQHKIFLNYWKAITNILGDEEPTVLFKSIGVELFCKFCVPFFSKMVNMPDYKISTMQNLLEQVFENVEGDGVGVGHTDFWVRGATASGLNSSALSKINTEMVKALHRSSEISIGKEMEV